MQDSCKACHEVGPHLSRESQGGNHIDDSIVRVRVRSN